MTSKKRAHEYFSSGNVGLQIKVEVLPSLPLCIDMLFAEYGGSEMQNFCCLFFKWLLIRVIQRVVEGSLCLCTVKRSKLDLLQEPVNQWYSAVVLICSLLMHYNRTKFVIWRMSCLIYAIDTPRWPHVAKVQKDWVQERPETSAIRFCLTAHV